MTKYSAFIIEKRMLVLGFVALVTLYFAYQLLGLRVNPSPYFLDQTHQSRIHELDIKSLFTNSGEQVLVALKPASGSPLDRPTVNLVKALTKKFESINLIDLVDETLLDSLRIDEVSTKQLDELRLAPPLEHPDRLRRLSEALVGDSLGQTQRDALVKLKYLYSPITKVRSFSTMENLTSYDDELNLHPLLPEELLTAEALTQFQNEVMDNPLFRELLVSDDLLVTTIQIELSVPKDDNRSTGYLYEKILEIVDSVEYSGEIFLAGNSVIDAEMARSMERDNLIFFPFVILLISSILYFFFRRYSGVYLPLTIAAITAIWTMGLMVNLGIEQNIVTTILPVFLLTVAVADAIHFYSYFISGAAPEQSVKDRLSATLSSLFRPLLLTSITTLFGFLALAWTEIRFIREFGLLMSAGVVFAFLLTMLLAPILALSVDTSANSDADRSKSRFTGLLVLFISSVLTHPFKALVLMLALLLGSGFCLQYLQYDQAGIENFDTSTSLRSDHIGMMEHYDGTIPIDIWIDTGEQGGIYDPEFIANLQRIESYLEERDDIGFVLSPVDFLKRMYDLLTYEGHLLPEGFDSGLVAQIILVYENERSQDIKHVIDDQHRHARFIVLGESDAASFWKPILADLESLAPSNAKMEINGYGKVMYTNIEEVIKTNISSTVIALVLIGFTMVLLFKSLVYGVIGILPLVLTVMMNYALMSIFGVAVDIGTTIVASIAFGIGIDYSIHYLSCIDRQIKQGETDLLTVLINATKIVGLPVAINSITLAGGFLVLVSSNFLILQLLGLFIAMTMLISAINALVLIPLLYLLWYRNSSRYATKVLS